MRARDKKGSKKRTHTITKSNMSEDQKKKKKGVQRLEKHDVCLCVFVPVSVCWFVSPHLGQHLFILDDVLVGGE